MPGAIGQGDDTSHPQQEEVVLRENQHVYARAGRRWCDGVDWPGLQIACDALLHDLGSEGLLEADDQLGGVATPVDRDYERAHVGRRHRVLRGTADDARYRDHELAAEIA